MGYTDPGKSHPCLDAARFDVRTIGKFDNKSLKIRRIRNVANNFLGMMRINFYLFYLITIKSIEFQNFGKPSAD